jgi:hypothetical protein
MDTGVIVCASVRWSRAALHKKSKIQGASKKPVTLKALANVSPGFAPKPWVQKCPRRLFATLRGLRGFAVNKRRRNPDFCRGCAFENEMRVPRVAKAQPRAGIGERFQRYLFPKVFSKVGNISTFCTKPSRVMFGCELLILTAALARCQSFHPDFANRFKRFSFED